MRSAFTAFRSHPTKGDHHDPSAGGLGGSPDADDLQISDYIGIVHKRLWLVVAIIAVGVGIAALYNWRATPVYQATATIQLEGDQNVLALDRPLSDSRDWMPQFLPTQLGILNSRELAKSAYEQLKASHGDPPVQNGKELTVGGIMAGRAVGEIRDTRLVNVGFRSTDPETAKEVANALARAYVQFNVQLKSRVSGEASDFLAEQVEQQRRLVQASEAALQQYRQKHGAEALLADDNGDTRQNVVVQKWAELQQAASRARADTIAKEADYIQLQAIQANRQPLETIPAIAANLYVQRLKADVTTLQRQLLEASNELGERHPEYIKLQESAQNAERKLQAEVETIAVGIRNDYEAAKSRERGLMAAVERQKGEVQALNAKAVEYTTLEREAITNREVLDKLAQRAREASLARELQASNVKIIDWAETPRSPVYPRKMRNLFVGFSGSAFLAFGLIFALELFNTRITSPQDVRRHLGISVLGVAPEVKRLKRATVDRPVLLSHGVPAQFTELLHGVRTNLVLAPELATTHTLLVTSSEPGEGKTAMAANIAVSLARMNQRVLLIDADLRKPQLHETFRTELQPGLTDLLKERTTQGIFRETSVARLWLLPAGKVTRNPADLLGSHRFDSLIKYLGEQFDWVVIDSPPVLAVTDPCLIARTASGVLFVVHSGQTSRQIASAALDRLDAVGANVVGALLNRADLKARGTSYLPYYQQDYEAYYAQQERPPRPELPPAALTKNRGVSATPPTAS